MEKSKAVTNKQVEECLTEFQKGYTNAFSKLDMAGREYMRKVVESYFSGDKALIEELYAVDYEHRCVDPVTFFTSKDYVGHFRKDIYDAWWPHLIKICEPKNGIFECILTGSLGIGKSTVGIGLVMSYHLHRVLCLKHPARFFGLGKDSKLVFGIYATDLKAAEDIGFFILRDQILADSPFFSSVYRRYPYGQDTIKFPKNIVIQTGSQSLHAAGKNLLAVAVDEMNLMRKGAATAKKAFDLANALSRRIESRFMQQGGEVPGCCIYIGSSGSQSDFIEDRARKTKNKLGHYVVRGVFWDFVKKINYCGKRFRVQVGGETTDSRILDNVERADNGVWAVTPVSELQEGSALIEVPVEHYTQFEVDLDGSIRDIAGVSTHSSLKFFANKEKIKAAILEDYKNPFPANIIKAYVGGSVELADIIEKPHFCTVKLGHYVPIRHPNSPRYIHIDLANVGDKAGICMVHPSSHIITVEHDEKDEDGLGLYDVRKEIEVDFAIGVSSGPHKEHIDFANIRRLVFHLRRLGFWIRFVSFDSFQSEDSVQRLREAKIPSDCNTSVDKTAIPYTITRTAMYGGRLKMPNIPELIAELADLELDLKTSKVDHSETGSKDISDSLAGACYKCLTDKITPSDMQREIRVAEIEDLRYDSYLGVLRELSPKD